ncbi:MAG TPA: YraN family protein [bacterium]
MRWFRPRDVLPARWLRGRRAEALACRYLARHGYRIERRNVRFPGGEIDVVARDGRCLCFLEVRSTSSSQWGGPLGSITDRKRRRLLRGAQWYLRYERAQDIEEIRFDVVAVDWGVPAVPEVQLVRGAFTADEPLYQGR